MLIRKTFQHHIQLKKVCSVASPGVCELKRPTFQNFSYSANSVIPCYTINEIITAWHLSSWINRIKIHIILDTHSHLSLSSIQMTYCIRWQINHVIYLLQSLEETCCSWTWWEIGAGALVWPWAPSISSPRTSRAVSWKHCWDQPQDSLSHALLYIEWQ